jgi:hypothetical protein
MLNLDYTNLIQLVQPTRFQDVKKPAHSKWFLVNIYRLEVLEVQNIVCDGQETRGLMEFM